MSQVENMQEWVNSDFVASGAYRSAPLGGVNEFSVDSSIVLNPPIGPDAEPIVFMWGYPESIPEKKRHGIQPVPSMMGKRPCYGASEPLRFSSPSIDLTSDFVKKEGGFLVLFMTSATRYREIQKTRDEAGLRAKYGTGALGSKMDSEAAGMMGSVGATMMTPEDDFVPMGAPLSTKGGRLKMAGPRN